MIISRKKRPPNPIITVGQARIDQVQEYNLLGVTITSDLNWSRHVSNTCLRAKRLLGCMYRTFNLADSKCLSKLYEATVRPILEYASCAWSPPQKGLRCKLERTQEFAAKIVRKCWSVSPSVLVDQLGWKSLLERRLYIQLLMVDRILRGESILPATLFTSATRLTKNHHSRALFLPRVRTDHYRANFFVSTVRHWNTLPDSIASLPTHRAFKRALRHYLLKT